MSDAAAHYEQGRTRLAAGQREEAIKCFERAVTLQPDHAEAWYQLGYTLSLLGRYDEARDHCLKAVALNPDYAEAYNNIGYTLFSAGRWEEALEYFSKATRVRPGYTRAHVNRGLCLLQLQRNAEAAESFRAALAVQPDFVEAQYPLAQACAGLQRWDEAAAALREVVRRQPEHVEAWYRLGKTAALQGHFSEAAACFRRVIGLSPDYAPAYSDLGLVCLQLGAPAEALGHYQSALARAPNDAETWYRSGRACMDLGRVEEAVTAFQQALAQQPAFADACIGLGNALLYLSRPEEAIVHFERALALQADPAPVYANLGTALQNLGRTDEALRLYRKAVELQPENAGLRHNLGTIWSSVGAADEALRCFEQAVRLRPDFVPAQDSVLLCRLYSNDEAPDSALLAAREFARRFEAPLKSSWPVHANTRDPARRLKIGYMSPDFRQHSVVNFIEPVLAHHDRREFEVCCYYNYSTRDEVTARMTRYSDYWLDCAGLTDAELAERIRADGIDVLVDLAGHTANNRLLVFARKPAPVQVSYLGYPATTGLTGMDWRLVTATTDPAGSERWHTEKLYRLPRSLWCYRPPAESPPVAGETPARRTGRITFGSMNNIAKVSDAAVTAWSELLKRVAGSQLVMTGLADGAQRRMRERFAAQGIGPERLSLHGRLDGKAFRTLLGDIDLALDTFPYAGTTTTCEALWMGIPVMTLIGETSVSRSGYALLTSIGLEELAARDEAAYLAIAIGLAQDIPRLDELRSGMRARLEASPLRDEVGLTRDLEAAYRAMWTDWCNCS